MKLRDKLYPTGLPYDNIELLPFDHLGLFNHPEVLEYCITVLKPKTVIEVGSFKGTSAIWMTQKCLTYQSDVEVICVDTFLGEYNFYVHPDFMHVMPKKNYLPNLLQTFLSNVVNVGLQPYITPVVIDSHNAYQIMKAWGIVADMIYIDGCHEYNAVVNDIKDYRELLRPNGIMVFDDFRYQPVQQAIKDTLGPIVENRGQQFGKYFWIKE